MRKLIIAPVCFDEYCFARDVSCIVGAASNKSLGFGRALVSAGEDVKIIGVPVVKAKNYFIKSYDGVCQGVKYTIAPLLAIKFISRIWMFFYLIYFAFKECKKNDSILLYNFFPEYIGIALVCRIKFGRNNVFLDIEDWVNISKYSLREIIGYFSFLILKKICSKKCIVVSERVAVNLNLKNYHCQYGFFDEKNKIKPRLNGKVVNILYGGSLTEGFGVNLFLSTIDFLVDTGDIEKFNFFVTGFCDSSVRKRIKNLAAKVPQVKFSINLSRAEYINQLNICDVGLSLRMPNDAVSDTTFPSKIAEYSCAGLLVISTDTPSIRDCFDNESLVIVKHPSASCVAENLIKIFNNRDYAFNVACNGQKKIGLLCGINNSGILLKKFLSCHD